MSAGRRTCVVVGGASGIGLAVAHAFAALGESVVVADLDEQRAAAAAAELGEGGRSARVDVTDEASIESLFADLGAAGPVHCVVNTAGVNLLGSVVEQPLEHWRTVLDVCLTGAFLVIKHAARVLGEDGAILTVSSLNGRQAGAGMAAYCSAKAGVEMLTQVSALELGERGIRVNAVAPGLVDTPLVAPITASPELRAEFLDNTPLRRIGTPEDIAEAIVFLCAPGSWITGETLAVDGGARTRRYPGLYDALTTAAGGTA
ncbi:SDR family NAD(P)-dependent oxidoreductase [Nocardioides insulae]|uniref:SDR family NAD(P)-dependent oxidoreductase n=1 Tax=Nocardioides insulae TaxID=394734 RepID=UPI00056C3AE7|nr:SDR family oxidoreductase [Nocardioides insulae]